ncbi:bifunctional UDP-sugar hydrolase/5'-nucleotidase [uncultured Muribaculum sp.]|uniref:bifunctional metallophosphatase/5'-nucleotidase n=1 Tax=uncultured Muribaculum sp. TaxID=1918613 RepID=UPI0025DB4E38|nr:bifunctional UDP-sugar hydrolase/5'-nucleotidase [uncultured Muribaculum sp.]
MKRQLLALGAAIAAVCAMAGELVILHTNDTHSAIDPDDKGRGGVVRRMEIIDSVREARPDVLLIDAGDAVQGTLYYTLYGGEVERRLMNALGYDIMILGNHEFDNGMERLADRLRLSDAELLASNYDMRGTPLDSLFKPYTIKEYGGKKVGIIALNLNPEGMIASHHTEGLRYLDAIKAANSLAWYLRNVEHADAVIAVTHIGYDKSADNTPSDQELAAASEGIDIIIGGHSHTVIDPESPDGPPFRLPNAAGDTVLLAQTGSRGRYLGEVILDLETMKARSRLLPVVTRHNTRADSPLDSIIAPYRKGIDALKKTRIGTLAQDMPAGSDLLLNWVADEILAAARGSVHCDVDLAIVNKGGIRRGLPKGAITKEEIMTMLPFDNHIVLLEIKGNDLIDAFKVMEGRGGDGVSGDFDWRRIDPDRTYILATIDYLANGGDYMEPLTHGNELYRLHGKLDEVIMKRIESRGGKAIKYDKSAPRM